jgi:hypothetical protein
MVRKPVVVAGGEKDPNLHSVLKRLADRGIDHLALLGGSSSPRLTWTLGDDRLFIEGEPVEPRAVFLRYDVFTFLSTGRPENRRQAARWYHAVLSWTLAHEKAAFPNRRYGTRQVSKPHVLALARRFGIDVPQTIISNDLDVVCGDAGMGWSETFAPLDEWAGDDWIVKPVNGGEYTRVLAEAVTDDKWVQRCSTSPNIIQRRLLSPDLRIYRIGKAWFAFSLSSGAIDYRTDRTVVIEPVPAPAGLVEPLRILMDHLGLDFGAADFKTCPSDGRYLFLEVNSAPMFSAFDRIAGGAMSDALVEILLAGEGQATRTTGLPTLEPLQAAMLGAST